MLDYYKGQKVRIHKPREHDICWVKGMDKYDGMSGIVSKARFLMSRPAIEVRDFVGKRGYPYTFIEGMIEVIDD